MVGRLLPESLLRGTRLAWLPLARLPACVAAVPAVPGHALVAKHMVVGDGRFAGTSLRTVRVGLAWGIWLVRGRLARVIRGVSAWLVQVAALHVA
jgi:hypothetical protein